MKTTTTSVVAPTYQENEVKQTEHHIMPEDVKIALDKIEADNKEKASKAEADEIQEMMDARMNAYQKAMAATFAEIVKGKTNE